MNVLIYQILACLVSLLSGGFLVYDIINIFGITEGIKEKKSPIYTEERRQLQKERGRYIKRSCLVFFLGGLFVIFFLFFANKKPPVQVVFFIFVALLLFALYHLNTVYEVELTAE